MEHVDDSIAVVARRHREFGPPRHGRFGPPRAAPRHPPLPAQPPRGIRYRRRPPCGIRYWFENAASNDAVGRGQMSERMNPTASFAPCRRSMPASSHSTEMGPA